MRANQEIYNAGIYLRISRDDEDKAESDSIQNQRELLKSFVAKDPEIRLADEFVDDGYTGTNFNRPGFQEMMDQVQAKKIDTIIVKDLSRLGRNYIETGRYIDQIFPLLKVRFISVNDNYDSFSDHNEADQIIVPFKNLINDAYCRDISMKIRSQLEVKRKNGKFCGAWAPYGYKKDPDDNSHLIIDGKAAEIVRMIFDMKIEGYSPSRIANKLNDLGILTPLQYKQSQGMNCNVGYWKSDNPHWVAPTVNRILTNETYVGTMVQGKVRKINYKVKKCQHVNEEDWVRVEGTHEPLVTRAVFDRVQELMKIDTRTSPKKETVDPLAGFVRCAYCGQNMHLVHRHKDGRTYKYYLCSTAKAGEDCESHFVNSEKLETAIHSLVKKQIALLLDVDELLEQTKDLPLESHRVKVISEQIETVEAEIGKYTQMKERLYKDFQSGIVDKEDYEDLKQKFVDSLEKSTKVKETLIKQRDTAKKEPILPPDWIEEVKNCSKSGRLDRKTVVMLIDEILVFDKDRVQVKFRYCDEMIALAEYLGQDSRFLRRKVKV